jgi:hypothetical protein
MSAYLFDLETDGLYNDCTQIHCVGVYDLDARKALVYNDQGNQAPISQAITMLEGADYIIGHNVINYDIPVIKKLYPWFKPEGQVIDTLLLSRLYHADILDIDQRRKWNMMPLKLYGRHSLESYGYRLGCFKQDFGKTTDWQEWSQEMQDYCEQDVQVTLHLWNHFHKYLNG